MKRRNRLTAAIITIIFQILLISCASTKYKFPSLGEVRRIDDGLNIIVYDKDDKEVFYYDGINDTVTIPYWYWIKLINYGINTDGI